jgi:hypothetical protein
MSGPPPPPYETNNGMAMPPMLPKPPPEVVKYSENSKNAKAVDPEGLIFVLLTFSDHFQSCQRCTGRVHQFHLLLGLRSSKES